jgi:cytochrome bd-type quinol oxidase subunit 2
MSANNKASWDRCKWRLAQLWLIAGGVVFGLLMIMSMTPKFGQEERAVQDAWGWFLTSMMPSLALIVGVLVSDATVAAPQRIKAVSVTHFRLAFGLSAFYLFVVMLTIAASSFPTVPNARRGVEMLRMSQVWLGPLQGLVSAALGIFFVRASPSSHD